MKRKWMAILCAMTLAFGVTATVSAADSPSGSVVDVNDRNDKDTAPQTGEAQWIVYGLAGAALLSGTAVAAKKQLKKKK